MSDDAKFTDLFRLSSERVSRTVRRDRLAICETCDHYSMTVKTCGLCGCVMPLKTTLAHAQCPAGKWGPAPSSQAQ